MKRVLSLTFLMLFSTLSMFSQSLSLSTPDGPLTNNQVYWVSGDYNLTLAALVYVTNKTSSDMEVMVKKTEISLVPGSSNLFCWALCYPPSVYVSPDPIVIPANSTDNTHFSGDYDPMGNMGISKIRYTFFKNNFPLDSVCVEVWFNAGYVGMDDWNKQWSFSPAFPNPAKDRVKFTYQLPQYENAFAAVRIFNTLGEQLCETIMIEKQGLLEIPVNYLKPGLYFYSLMLKGETVLTRKLVVE